MKVQLSLCAQDLPCQANVYAVIRVDGSSVGKTDVESDTDDPSWSKIVVLEADPDQSVVSVTVLKSGSDDEIGSVDFSMQQVMEQEGNAMAQSMESGGAIAVHMVEHTDTGMLQLQLRGKRFKNMEGFMNRSDPYFELKGLEGQTVYRSEVVQDNLNPKWSVATVSVQELTGGDLDSPIPVMIYDKDADGQRDFMGEFALSINGFLSAKHHIDMEQSGGKKTGEISVLGASLVPQEEVSKQAKEAMEVCAKIEVERWIAENRIRAAKQTAEKKKQAAAAAQNLAEDAKNAANAKTAEAETAAQAVADAKQAAVDLKEIAQQAADEAKTKPCTGTFRLALRGSDFEDTDGFRNVSDPYFEIFGAKGEAVFQSEVMKDTLNPVWPAAEIELSDLCNGDLDMPIRIAFFDSDEGTTKKDYFGQLQMSINAFLQAKGSDPMDMVKGGKQAQGKVFVEGTPQIVDFKDLKQEAAKAREAALEAKRQVYAKLEVSNAAQEAAQAAQSAAEEAAKAAQVAAEEAETAQQAVAQAEAGL